MIWRQFLSLANLIKAQILYFHELSEVIMMSKEKNLIFAAFSEVTSSIKCLNNS